ncbi:FAD-binding oxidoreductase [Candidatus Nitrospira allomarina]|uniref:FAD-binding oxidoreductase n=1 Tax=Candidatus Nitrospira allomarina TaxID=3020900 RepID=A0AA96JVL8_9BACT|nr:FAD-binding oxidoreductase [Candidatus Nitrospira allomarina]WNM57061.1 FAD-binding oxidoreductase [Candidatus Nitrospira allomarina]
MQEFNARVSRVKDLTHDVRELALTLLAPDAIDFKAGQWISLTVWNPGLKQHVQRQYSIASPPSQYQQITLLFNRVPDGPGSNYLFGLHEGDPVTFQGPNGSFFLQEKSGRDLVLVATGTGIASFRSMLSTFLEEPEAGILTLYWGLRSQRDLYYQHELEALARRHPNFRFITILSRPEKGWKGPIGRVTTLVENHIASVSNVTFYLCGNGGMIRDTTAIVRKKGLCPIRTEQYYDKAGAGTDV